MASWQPVSVPDFCPTCGVYWECGCSERGAGWQPIEAQLISSRPSEDGWGREDLWEFPGTSYAAEIQKQLSEVELAEGDPPPAYS